MSPTEEAAAKLAASRTTLSPPLGRNASEQMVLQPQQEVQQMASYLQEDCPPGKQSTQADVLKVPGATSGSEAVRSCSPAAKLSSAADSLVPPTAGFQSLLQPALAPGAPAPPTPMRQLDATRKSALLGRIAYADCRGPILIAGDGPHRPHINGGFQDCWWVGLPQR
jgi:hypothetical protein